MEMEETIMTKETVEFVTAKTKELMAAPSCSKEAKDAAQAWLNAVGTANGAEETKKYIAELEADITTIDGLIAFAGSDAGKSVFGADVAPKVVEQAKAAKANGAVYCFCDACKAAEAILSKKSELL